MRSLTTKIVDVEDRVLIPSIKKGAVLASHLASDLLRGELVDRSDRLLADC